MGRSPYSGRPSRAFWRGGVAGGDLFPRDIYQPRFEVSRDTKVCTAGSCFAQHVGQALRDAGLSVIDTEPPRRGLPPETSKRFGFGLFSARFGNIFTLRQFRQLIAEAFGEFKPANPVWEKDGKFWDAMRPGVEPDGVATPEIVEEMRAEHLRAVKQAITQADVCVFTLGLTEAWTDRATGTVYPTAPGTIAGTYDPDNFAFQNFGVADMLEDFTELEAMVRAENPDIRWLLTVSPVPLSATATDDHVLTATMRSKAALRVVCDILCDGDDRIDYFPSYELVQNPALAGKAFSDDLRAVAPEVVASVMATFLAAHGIETEADEDAPTPVPDAADADTLCEDILLDAFRP